MYEILPEHCLLQQAELESTGKCCRVEPINIEKRRSNYTTIVLMMKSSSFWGYEWNYTTVTLLLFCGYYQQSNGYWTFGSRTCHWLGFEALMDLVEGFNCINPQSWCGWNVAVWEVSGCIYAGIEAYQITVPFKSPMPLLLRLCWHHVHRRRRKYMVSESMRSL